MLRLVGHVLLVLCVWGSVPCVWAAPSPCAAPNVMLVLDTSGSMSEDGKLKSLQQALTKTVNAFKDSLRFGLIHFGGTEATLDLQVGPADPQQASAHVASLVQLVEGLTPLGQTPMRSALQLARKNFEEKVIPEDALHKDPALNRKRVHVVLLITDGESTDGDPLPEIGKLYNLQVDSKLYQIKTFVVGIGAGTAIRPFYLSQMALRGGTKNYYRVVTQQDMERVFQQVAQEITSRQELCNGEDDNCDGQIDENLQRECASDCGTGVQRCQAGKWSVCDAPKGGVEVCDGHDNDCDGQVDEGLRRDCSTGCGKGEQLCVHGDWSTCNAPPPQQEVCNGKDDDCDGVVDEVATACPGGACRGSGADIICEIPCRNGECPGGFACDTLTSRCRELPCRRKVCPPGQVCLNEGDKARCLDKCANVQCPAGQTCGRDGTCVNCYEKGCPPQMVCKEGRCVVDKCAGVQCGVRQACSDGACLDTCADKECPTGMRCQTLDPKYPKALCFPDACAGIQCAAHRTCVRGVCVTNRCLSKEACGDKQICDPERGVCSDDPCLWTHCPAGTLCQKGECVASPSCPALTKGGCCEDAHCGPASSCQDARCVSSLEPGSSNDGGGAPYRDIDSPGSGRSTAGCACQAQEAAPSVLSCLLLLLFLCFLGGRRTRRDDGPQRRRMRL